MLEGFNLSTFGGLGFRALGFRVLGALTRRFRT